MAKPSAVLDTGRTLVAILRQRLVQLDPENILLATPADFAHVRDRPGVTIFLYRVAVNPQLRNAPARRNVDGSRQRQPLPVELGYLVTPWVTDDKESEQLVIGDVLQAFYDHSELGPTDLLGDSWQAGDSVQLILDTLPLEDHYRIWDTTAEPYRLSLTYTARVVGIDPAGARLPVPIVDASFRPRPPS